MSKLWMDRNRTLPVVTSSGARLRSSAAAPSEARMRDEVEVVPLAIVVHVDVHVQDEGECMMGDER